MITIVDYKLGNPGSVYNMVKYLGFDAEITSEKSKIIKAGKLILSGVGSFDTGMFNLYELGLNDLLHKKVMEEKVPILGICLGMQLMGDESEEGEQRGLGWIKGTSVRFKAEDLRVPHMMWNKIKLISESKLFNGLEENSRFYFAHSYYMESVDPDLVIAKSIYGREFVAAIESENIIGVQFHPEKSHKFGMKLLRNFITEY